MGLALIVCSGLASLIAFYYSASAKTTMTSNMIASTTTTSTTTTMTTTTNIEKKTSMTKKKKTKKKPKPTTNMTKKLAMQFALQRSASVELHPTVALVNLCLLGDLVWTPNGYERLDGSLLPNQIQAWTSLENLMIFSAW